MTRTTITLPDSLASLVADVAKQRGSSVSAVVRQALEKEFGGTGSKPRKLGLVGLFDDPDLAPAADLEKELGEEWADAVDRDRG